MEKLRIRLLGGVEIAGNCEAGPAVLSKKAKALLAYLALQRGRPQSREKLAALLWQDSPDEQARTNLRQALSSIRKVLTGHNAGDLVADRDQISLCGPDIDLDVAEFEQLVAKATPDSLKQAADLYRGDLLDGFSLKEDSFETWTRAERERLRHLACNVLTELTAHYDEVGDTDRCLETAARLLTLDPLREAAHRMMMHTYAAQGRQASALKQFEACKDMLERELGVEPETETVALYHDIRTQRAVASKGEPTTGEKRESDGPPLPVGSSLETKYSSLVFPAAERIPRWPVIAAGLLGLIVVIGVALWQRPWMPRIERAVEADMAFPLPDKPSVAVLPFDNLSNDPEQEHIADGLTDDLVTDLSKIGDLFVIARDSTFVYKGQAVEISQVAEDLGVRYIVEGSVRRAGGLVRVNAQLIDATTGRNLWAERFDGELTDIFRVQDEFARRIVEALKVNLRPQEAEQIAQGKTDNLTAWESFQKGWDLYLRFNAEDNAKSIGHFEAAIEADAEFGRAHAAIGLAYLAVAQFGWGDTVGGIGKRQAKRLSLGYLDKAIKRRTALAYVVSSYFHLMYAEHEDALAHAARALALDPNDPQAHIVMAWVMMTKGRPEEGLGFIDSATRLNPSFPSYYAFVRGIAYFAKGDLQKAAEVLQTSLDKNPEAVELAPPLAAVYALHDQRELARKTIQLRNPELRQIELSNIPNIYRFPIRWDRQHEAIRERLYDGIHLAVLPLEVTVPSLIKTLKGDDNLAQLNAIQTLGRFGPKAEAAVPVLIDALDDEDVRKEVVLALGKIGPAAKDAVPALRALENEILIGSYAKEAIREISTN